MIGISAIILFLVAVYIGPIAAMLFMIRRHKMRRPSEKRWQFSIRSLFWTVSAIAVYFTLFRMQPTFTGGVNLLLLMPGGSCFHCYDWRILMGWQRLRLMTANRTGLGDTMKRPRFRFGLRTWFIAFTCVCVYVGGYITLLDRKLTLVRESLGTADVVRQPNYRLASSMLTAVFLPIHRADRFARSEYWCEITDRETIEKGLTDEEVSTFLKSTWRPKIREVDRD